MNLNGRWIGRVGIGERSRVRYKIEITERLVRMMMIVKRRLVDRWLKVWYDDSSSVGMGRSGEWCDDASPKKVRTEVIRFDNRWCMIFKDYCIVEAMILAGDSGTHNLLRWTWSIVVKWLSIRFIDLKRKRERKRQRERCLTWSMVVKGWREHHTLLCSRLDSEREKDVTQHVTPRSLQLSSTQQLISTGPASK